MKRLSLIGLFLVCIFSISARAQNANEMHGAQAPAKKSAVTTEAFFKRFKCAPSDLYESSRTEGVHEGNVFDLVKFVEYHCKGELVFSIPYNEREKLLEWKKAINNAKNLKGQLLITIPWGDRAYWNHAPEYSKSVISVSVE